MKGITLLDQVDAQVEQAKKALFKVQSEIMRRQLSQPQNRHLQLPHRLSNAQYFVHELYYYLGFEPLEIAEQTTIKLSTVMDLISETVRILSDHDFQQLIYFYAAAAKEKIAPQCSFKKSNIQVKNSDIGQEFTDYMTSLADPGFRHMVFMISKQEHTLIFSEKNAANE